MRASFLLLSLFLLMTGPSVRAQREDSCCRLRSGRYSLRELGREYRRLRRQAGGDCCNRYGSGLMQALQQLHDSLPAGTPQRRVTMLMGRPDVSTGGAYDVIRPGRGERLLVYHWRGRHDFLYFVVRKGLVIRRDWYWALE